MLLFGHLDNQMRTDKTVNGMRELVEKGYTPYSIPRGYVNLNKGSKAVNQQIVLNEEGKLLRKAFHWKAEQQMRNCESVERLAELGLKIDERRLSETFANPYYFYKYPVFQGAEDVRVIHSSWFFLKIKKPTRTADGLS